VDAGSLTMYTTTWCGYCIRLKRLLDRDGVAFLEVDIEDDPIGADFVTSVNGGSQTVPTLRFADGSTLTNPTMDQVRQRLSRAS